MTSKSTLPEARRDGTVSRVLRLLTIFGEADGPLGVHTISQSAGLPISTVHRLVNLIASEGFVQYDASSRLYAPGPQMHRLTAMLWNSGPAVAAQPILDGISAKFDETVMFLLYLPDELAISPIAKHDGARALRYVVNMNTPIELARGASGKSILAHLEESTVRSVYERADPDGPPLPAWDEYLEQLRIIRERGYASSAGERTPGAQAVGSVVFGGLDEVVGGICLTFPSEGLSAHSTEELGAEVSAAARELSSRLGAHIA